MRKIKALLQSLLVMLTWNLRVARAEEGGDPPATPAPTPTTSAPTIPLEKLLADVRKEEKDKLYPQIEALKKDKDTLTKRINELIMSEAQYKSDLNDLKAQLESAKKGQGDPEEVKTLKAKVKELEGTIQTLTTENNSIKLGSVKDKLVAGANGRIIAEMVTGNTEEELTASVETAKAKYEEYFGKVAPANPANVVLPNANYVQPVNPNVKTIDLKTLTADQISQMSPKEWAEYRKQIGMK